MLPALLRVQRFRAWSVGWRWEPRGEGTKRTRSVRSRLRFTERPSEDSIGWFERLLCGRPTPARHAVELPHSLPRHLYVGGIGHRRVTSIGSYCQLRRLHGVPALHGLQSLHSVSPTNHARASWRTPSNRRHSRRHHRATLEGGSAVLQRCDAPSLSPPSSTATTSRSMGSQSDRMESAGRLGLGAGLPAVPSRICGC